MSEWERTPKDALMRTYKSQDKTTELHANQE